MAQIDYTTTSSVSTINYIGTSAFKAMYKRIKHRVDGIDAINRSIIARLDIIEEEATNVIALTNDELLDIVADAKQEESGEEAINYTKIKIKYT